MVCVTGESCPCGGLFLWDGFMDGTAKPGPMWVPLVLSFGQRVPPHLGKPSRWKYVVPIALRHLPAERAGWAAWWRFG